MSENTFEEQLQGAKPRCIENLRIKPAVLPEPWDDNFSLTYALACSCGHEPGRILGHPLKGLIPDVEDVEMVSPFFFECVACAKVSDILDTQVHGYNAEIGAREEEAYESVKLMGEGDPKPFACPSCRNDQFKVIVSFVFWDFDILEDEPDWPGQDFFNVFVLYGCCKHCQTPTLVCGMDV